MNEEEFHKYVAEWLMVEFGAENVEHERYLQTTYRFVDFWVETHLCNYAIEVESNFHSVLTGMGQSMLYAAHEPNTIPVVIVPKGEYDEPEATLIQEKTPVVLYAIDAEFN